MSISGGKIREVFSEREASIEATHALNRAEYEAWVAILGAAHCSHCSTLIVVPYHRREERYIFNEASYAHELGCPDA